MTGKITVLSKSYEEQLAASSWLKYNEKFEFIVFVFLLTKLLEKISVIYNTLKNQYTVLDKAFKLVREW